MKKFFNRNKSTSALFNSKVRALAPKLMPNFYQNGNIEKLNIVSLKELSA
jgi:hypothetical protein